MIRGRMKKLLLVALIVFVACGKQEEKQPEPPIPVPTPPRASAPAPAPAPDAGSTGDYDKAVAWMRTSPGYHFDMAIGDVKASGELTRPQAGREQLRFRAGSEEWKAERKLTGVTWYRNGTHDANEPPYADRIYQWMTFFPDPQKSNVQVVGTEGDETHIRFTTANTNETEDVWIRRADNHLTRLTTSGAGKAFPAVELTIR